MPNLMLLDREISRKESSFQTGLSNGDQEEISSTKEGLLEPLGLNYLIKANQVLDSSPISSGQVSLPSEEEKSPHIFTPSSAQSLEMMDNASLTKLALDEISNWQKTIALKRKDIKEKESRAFLASLDEVNSHLSKLKKALSRKQFSTLYEIVIKFTTECSDIIANMFPSQEESRALASLTNDLVELCFRTRNPDVSEKSSDYFPQSSRPIPKAGIRNPAVACFVISQIQQFFHNKEVRNRLLSVDPSELEGYPRLLALQKNFMQLAAKDKGSVSLQNAHDLGYKRTTDDSYLQTFMPIVSDLFECEATKDIAQASYIDETQPAVSLPMQGDKSFDSAVAEALNETVLSEGLFPKSLVFKVERADFHDGHFDWRESIPDIKENLSWKDPTNPKADPREYRLTGTLNFSGTAVKEGHYWSTVDDLDGLGWTKLNDSRSSSLSNHNAALERARYAYMLYYTRIDSPSLELMDNKSLTELALDEISNWQKTIALKRKDIKGKESRVFLASLDQVNNYLSQLKNVLSQKKFSTLYDILIKFTTECSDIIADMFPSEKGSRALTSLTNVLVELSFRTRNPEVNENSSDDFPESSRSIPKAGEKR